MTADLLIEMGTEDLPARYLQPLLDALAEGVVAGLDSRGIAHGELRRFATPRRLAVAVSAVAERQADQQIERSGPALSAAMKGGQPTPAALGFARSCGVPFAELSERDGKLFYATSKTGEPTAALVQSIFDECLRQMDALVPKRMRWGTGDDTFVRPVQWLLALHGDEVVPLSAFGLDAGRLTYGHRFHAPAAISLQVASAYEATLKAAHVWADVKGRRDDIRRQIEAEATRLNGHARITEALLDEVTALVEWPVAITGHFEARFLALPPEVIVATVETNQRYFTVFEDAEHRRLTAAFITVCNIDSRDVKQVIQGNERVVRPRLSDALFFFDQDRQQPFAERASALAALTFQKALGSVADKVARIVDLTGLIATAAGATVDERNAACRAAALCKCDLVTQMVFEFPELQGVMGGYYAAAAGESEATALAIRDHYQPTQQGMPIPTSRQGQWVALADKLDTLAGIFATGQKPTASKDPFALRRTALGVLRILIEGEWALDLRVLFAAAVAAVTQRVTVKDVSGLEAELLEFTLERLRALRVGTVSDGREITVESFDAVRALGLSTPLDIDTRLRAVHRFAVHPAAPNLAAAHKRIRNLLRQADGAFSEVDPERFAHTSEHAVWNTLVAIEERNTTSIDYTEQLINLASLRDPVDAFFEGVMVNADDAAVRNNRLALLARMDRLCRTVADISRLPG